MKQRTQTPTLVRRAASALLALAAACLVAAPAFAQTSGGTQINNQASASYSDGSTTYTVVSNTVTVTVANVSGLVITPDAGSRPTVVGGQTNVDFTFTVTNSGNYATQVRFPANGGAIFPSGPVTVTAAVIDVDGDGLDAAEDVNIFSNGAPVLYPSASPYLARKASVNVVVRVTVNAGAASGASLGVTLGDAAADNEAAESSNTEVRTSVPASVTAPVNGESEGVGSITTTVEDDARLRVTLSAPAGPIALGSDINYTTQVCNVGDRVVSSMTLGGNTGVFIVAPVPVGTSLKSGQTFTGSVLTLYSTDSLTGTSPAGPPPVTLQPAASWSATAPGDLSTVRRVAFKVADSLAVGAGGCSASISYLVTVTTTNATQPIREMVDAFGSNTSSARITDQSDGQSAGAQTEGQGDGNALGLSPQPNPGLSGTPILTPLMQVGSVLIGPSGAPAAVGPTDNNDDYTNKSVAPAAIAGRSHLDTLAGAVSVDFVNTVQNTGNADDTFTLTVPTAPAGFTVEISTDGVNFVPASSNPTIALAFGASANVTVRVTTTSNAAVLQGFSTVLRATSANTPASSNNTIDRLYTGFLRLEKAVTVINNTSVGNNQSTPGPDDAVPGADLEYVITYTNISAGGGGAGCVNLVASSVVITERGDVAPNNWAANTSQVTSPAPADANTTGTPGSITDETTGLAVTAATVRLRDSVPNLNPGASGTFTFRRRIN
jgi:hypothetical protein